MMLPDKPTNDAAEYSPIDEPQDDDTLIVAPPGFRERLLAAQKARTSEIRQSVEIPNPLARKPEDAAAPREAGTSSDPNTANPLHD